MCDSFVCPWAVAHQAPLCMGISQARTLEWVPISLFRRSFEPRDWNRISWIGRRVLYYWATREFATAASAKSLQSCLTLCDPIDGSPPGSAVPGILQARTLEWVAISFSNREFQFSSVQFSHSVVSDSLRPHELQHARPFSKKKRWKMSWTYL